MNPSERRVAFIVNPVSEEGIERRLGEAMARIGVDGDWYATTETDPGSAQTEEAIARGAGLIVACGGDGTVRACVEVAAKHGTPVALIPTGTGNLLARNLGIPLDLDAAAGLVKEGTTHEIDVGFVNDEAFVVMAGIGLDAALMRDTDRTAKNAVGSIAYVVSALRHLHDDKFECSIEVDSAPTWRGRASSALVANHGKLQGGVALFPDADAADGRVDLLVVSAQGIGDWLRAALAVIRNDGTGGPVNRAAGRQISITTGRPVPYQLDGEERDPATEFSVGVGDERAAIVTPKDGR